LSARDLDPAQYFLDAFTKTILEYNLPPRRLSSRKVEEKEQLKSRLAERKLTACLLAQSPCIHTTASKTGL